MPVYRPEPIRRARRRRYILPGHWQHVSARTLQGRYAFEGLTPEQGERVWGYIGRANARYGVEIACFNLMGNHFHALIRGHRSSRVSKWVQYVKSNLARLTHEAHDTEGTVWAGPYRHTNLLNDQAELAWFHYICSHGVKEGLVAHPAAWPGPNCINALLTGEKIKGTWLDKEALRKARAKDPTVSSALFLEEVPVELTPLSPGARTEATWRKICEDTINSIVAEHLSRDLPKVYETFRDFTFVPEKTKKSRNFCFDARTLSGEPDLEALKEAEAARRNAVEASVFAMQNLAQRGLTDVEPPHGTQWPAPIAEALGEAWAVADFPCRRRSAGVQQAAG